MDGACSRCPLLAAPAALSRCVSNGWGCLVSLVAIGGATRMMLAWDDRRRPLLSVVESCPTPLESLVSRVWNPFSNYPNTPAASYKYRQRKAAKQARVGWTGRCRGRCLAASRIGRSRRLRSIQYVTMRTNWETALVRKCTHDSMTTPSIAYKTVQTFYHAAPFFFRPSMTRSAGARCWCHTVASSCIATTSG